jgi:hypothetical protein
MLYCSSFQLRIQMNYIDLYCLGFRKNVGSEVQFEKQEAESLKNYML